MNNINNKIVNKINSQYINYDIYIWYEKECCELWINLIIFANINLIIINSNFIIISMKLFTNFCIEI